MKVRISVGLSGSVVGAFRFELADHVEALRVPVLGAAGARLGRDEGGLDDGVEGGLGPSLGPVAGPRSGELEEGVLERGGAVGQLMDDDAVAEGELADERTLDTPDGEFGVLVALDVGADLDQ